MNNILIGSYNYNYLLNYNKFIDEINKFKKDYNSIKVMILEKNILTFKGFESHIELCTDYVTIDSPLIDAVDVFTFIKEFSYYNNIDEFYIVFYGVENE